MRGFGNTNFWCHMSLETGDRHTNKDIRESRPLKVDTFRDLVKTVARISNHNPDYSLFYRGQAKDYKIKSGASSFYPSIYRKLGGSLLARELSERFEMLDKCSVDLIIKLDALEIDNLPKIKKFQELQWSILQHYEVCATPLLDFTQSLRVAASFALNNTTNSESAYIFIFAFPHPNGTISYSTEDELFNIRLLSACPSDALRPHFQEGFLVGDFPKRAIKKEQSLDYGRRLIAKIEINQDGFWGNDFHAIPHNALYPQNDEVEFLCSEIKSKYASK